jgi:hypothetical protein
LQPADWIAIIAIVTANVVSVRTDRQPGREPRSTLEENQCLQQQSDVLQ